MQRAIWRAIAVIKKNHLQVLTNEKKGSTIGVQRKGGVKMTQKEIIMLASNPDLMELLREIAEEERNLIHKTIYEQKSAKKRMKSRAAEIVETLKAK